MKLRRDALRGQALPSPRAVAMQLPSIAKRPSPQRGERLRP